MSWKEEEEQRNLKEMIEYGEILRTRARRGKLRIALLAAAVVLFIAADLVLQERGARLPMDLSEIDQTVVAWRESGFLVDLNWKLGIARVHGPTWNELGEEERTSVVAFLALVGREDPSSDAGHVIVFAGDSNQLLASFETDGMYQR